jgi:hypothetical protein
METVEKMEVFLVNMALVEDEAEDAVKEEHMECISIEEEIGLWLIRRTKC